MVVCLEQHKGHLINVMKLSLEMERFVSYSFFALTYFTFIGIIVAEHF